MDRTVMFVGEAATPTEVTNGVLARFGFSAAETVPTLAAAVTRLRDAHFDVVFVPLQEVGPVELAVIEHDIRPSASFIIGTAPGSRPEVILSALRAGIHEFVSSPIEATELGTAVDRLVRRMTSSSARAGTTLAVYSAKGGLGTTTIAINLAAALAKQQPTQRVALADFVVVGGDVRVQLDLRPAYDVGDLVSKVDRIDGDLLYSLLTQGPSGVWTLPSTDNPEALDLVDANAATTIIGHLRAHFGFVVVDTEHYLSERTLAALDAADCIVLVTQLYVPALRSTQRTLQLFDRLGYARDKVVIVVNRSDAKSALRISDAEEVLHRPILWRLPNDFGDCSEATTKGLPIIEYDPGAALSRSFLNLAAKLAGTVTSANVARTTGAAPDKRTGRVLRLGRR